MTDSRDNLTIKRIRTSSRTEILVFLYHLPFHPLIYWRLYIFWEPTVDLFDIYIPRECNCSKFYTMPAFEWKNVLMLTCWCLLYLNVGCIICNTINTVDATIESGFGFPIINSLKTSRYSLMPPSCHFYFTKNIMTSQDLWWKSQS